MKNQKNLGQPLSEQEMKSIKGGHVFSSSQYGVRCPACGKEEFERTSIVRKGNERS